MADSRQALMGAVGNAMQAYQRSTQAFDYEVGRQLGLNPADLRCLDWLVDRPRTPTELSEATGLSGAATTAMIDRLERKGFVHRSRGEADRRNVFVAMTPQGRLRTEEFYGPLVLEGMDILGKLGVGDMAIMLSHLESIRELTDRQTRRLREG